VIDLVDPDGKYFVARLYRNNCIKTETGVRVKDLWVISNRNLDDVWLVDNAAYSFGHYIGNGIPILSYFDDREDWELLYLASYLENIAQAPNIKEANSRAFQLEQLSDQDIKKYI
jgi:CTD small phosphatase-like protein 2